MELFLKIMLPYSAKVPDMWKILARHVFIVYGTGIKSCPSTQTEGLLLSVPYCSEELKLSNGQTLGLGAHATHKNIFKCGAPWR